MTIRDYYNQYWSDDGFHPTGQFDPEVSKVLHSHIPRRSNVLDVGCGDGLAAGKMLVGRECDYTGVDVSENAVREARRNGLSASLIEDASSLPFEDASFDVVISLEVIEHLFSPLEAVMEMKRVLAPGGLLLLTTPNTAYWRLRMDMCVLGKWNPLGDDKAVEQPWRDPHIRFFTVDALSNMLKAAGFEDVEVSGCKGHLIKSLPGVQRLLGAYLPEQASWPYRKLQALWPSALAARLYSLARTSAVAGDGETCSPTAGASSVEDEDAPLHRRGAA